MDAKGAGRGRGGDYSGCLALAMPQEQLWMLSMLMRLPEPSLDGSICILELETEMTGLHPKELQESWKEELSGGAF